MSVDKGTILTFLPLSSTALPGLIHSTVPAEEEEAVLQNHTAATPPPGPGTVDLPLVSDTTVKILPHLAPAGGGKILLGV